MLKGCHNEIKQQINSSQFLAIQADETTDVANLQQMVLIFRFVHEGTVVERFWSFVPHGYTAQHLTDALLAELKRLTLNPIN
jgi:hypothetical protein